MPQKAVSEISLLIADIDGSLITSDKKLTEGARHAIHQLRDAGIQISLTSGRPPRGMRMFIDDLKITLPISGFDGGILIHPDLSVIEAYCIPEKTIASIFDILSQYHLDIWAYTQQDWFVPSRHGAHVDHEEKTVQFSPIVVSHLSRIQDPLLKIVGVTDDAEAMTRCEKALQKAMAGQVTAALSQPYYLDITHPKANKGTVVHTLSRLLNIPANAIATIGDMPSDIFMFKDSGLSIAMGNAQEDVKRQADYVTTSNDAEGFANAIDRFLLQPDRLSVS